MRPIWMALSFATVGLIPVATSSMAIAGEPTSEDQKQEREIHAEFRKTPELRHSRIEVNVDDGIAVLEGTVDSNQQKKDAQQVAHVDGILGVNNRLKVRDAQK